MKSAQHFKTLFAEVQKSCQQMDSFVPFTAQGLAIESDNRQGIVACFSDKITQHHALMCMNVTPMLIEEIERLQNIIKEFKDKELEVQIEVAEQAS